MDSWTELLCMDDIDLEAFRTIAVKPTSGPLVLDRTAFHPDGDGLTQGTGTPLCGYIRVDVTDTVLDDGRIISRVVGMAPDVELEVDRTNESQPSHDLR